MTDFAEIPLMFVGSARPTVTESLYITVMDEVYCNAITLVQDAFVIIVVGILLKFM